jgi:hypothetical protein
LLCNNLQGFKIGEVKELGRPKVIAFLEQCLLYFAREVKEHGGVKATTLLEWCLL